MKKLSKLFTLLTCALLTLALLSGCGGAEDSDAASEETSAKVADPALQEQISPLINSLCFSEGLHYDAFSEAPDDVTTTYTMWHLVTYTDFRDKAMIPEFEGAYYFSDAPESEEMADDREKYYGPGDLYADYFTKGEFQYAPEEISFLIEGTQTGVAVHMSDAPYSVDTTINEVLVDGDKLIVKVSLQRGTFDEEPPTKIGDAEIILTKNDRGLYGYTVTSFTPSYPEFETIFLQ